MLVSAIFQCPKIDFLNFQPTIGYMDDHKGTFRRTKNTAQIKICPKFEGGNGLII